MPLVLYKILVTGDRGWSSFAPIERYISLQARRHGTQSLLLIAGGAAGADTIAKIVATDLSVHTAEIDALWDTRHRSAGGQRNDVMLALAPHEVMGFHADIRSSRGTKNCLKAALALGIPARLFDGRRTVRVTRETLGLRP